jgi:hypothetical protein
MTEQTPEVPMTPPPAQRSSGGNRTLTIVLVILLVLCLCCICGGGGFWSLWTYGDQWFGLVRPLLTLL